MNAERTLKRACPSGSGKGGFVLPVTMMVIAVLSLWGATFLTLSQTEHTIASNEVSTARAFNIAEAGLERTKARLKTGPEPTNAFLSGTSPGPNPFGSTPAAGNAFDGGNYIVVITDDNDDADQTTDSNNRVFIRSTGTFGTAQKQILALVTTSPPLPTPNGAGEVLTTGTWELHGDPGGRYDGRDWNAPADLSTCEANPNCGAVTGNPTTRGGFSNDASGSFDLIGGGTMFGTGCLPPSPCTSAATASNTIDTSSPSNRWDSVIDALIPQATRTLTLNGNWNAGSVTWGTPAAPEVTVINVNDGGPGTDRLDWQSQVNGAGVLIIESPGSTGTSGVYFQSTAVLNWQGLVIVRSPGTMQFELSNGSGRVRVFGQVVNRSLTRAEIELNTGNNKSFINYSSGAMNVIRQSFLPGVTVRSWQEVPL
ncbi:MAG: pilus assembly PilX family protein [Candidatus Methylomirabilales bacterium]